VDALRTLIDAFPRLDTLSLHGAVTEPALLALYHDASSDRSNSGFKYSMPKTVRSVIISDYRGNGEVIYQRLHEMHTDPVPNGESVKIILQDCLNIRPGIRKRLSSSPAIQFN
jgi:hypothetical protein